MAELPGYNPAMIPVRLDDKQARVGALDLPFECIRLRLLWRVDDDQKPGGHAYVLDDDDDTVTIVGLQHEVIDQQGMLALLGTVDERLDVDEDRNWTIWRPPEDGTHLFGDLGALGELLRGRHLRLLDAASGLAPTNWRLPPESFLRAPVGAWAQDLLGVDWPERWEASALRERFLAARRGHRLAFTGCRYGSIHAGSGQDRTAAVFLSEDAGGTWTDLPWRLSKRQARSSYGRWCFPPEELLGVRFEPELVIEWDDPWILWEPGREWQATWDGEVWRMKTRSRALALLRSWSGGRR